MSTDTRPVVLRRYGGDRQPLLETFADAISAVELPEASWAVLSCPVDGLVAPKEFLQALDSDQDGRIRCDDVRQAVRWTGTMLRSLEAVDAGRDRLRVSDLSDAAQAHRRTAEVLAGALGRTVSDELSISLADLNNADALSACGDRNGDGVVPIHCLEGDLATVAKQVVTVVDAVQDRTGRDGINSKVLDAFVAAREAVLAWREKRPDLGEWSELGDDAAQKLARRVLADAEAITAWFALAELASFDPDAAAAADKPPAGALDGRDPAAISASIAGRPIAPVSADGLLHATAIRPGPHAALLPELLASAGLEHLNQADWQRLLGRAKGLVAWIDAGSALPGCKLADADLHAVADASLASLRELCDLDSEQRGHVKHLAELEKLLLFQINLFAFCRNFVALADLYDPEAKAVFERGRLILAGRSFHFAIAVDDKKKHAKRAEESGIFVLYVEVERREKDKAVKELVAVPVTQGTSDGLFIGRRGIFIDRQGRYHSATIIATVDNPVSMTETLLAPFTKIGNYLTKRLEGWSKKLDGDFDKQVGQYAKAGEDKDAKKPPPKPDVPAPAGGSPLLGGTVAFAALSSAFAFVTKQLSEIGAPKILLAMVVVVGLIMVPTSILAAVRLHRRNLAGLIAASGWAVNDAMRLTGSLGRLFTRRPSMPPEVRTELRDIAETYLQKLDPKEASHARWAAFSRWLSVGAVLALSVAVILPKERIPSLDVVVFTGLIWDLMAVVIAAFIGREQRPTQIWNLLLMLPVLVLTTVYFWGSL